MAKTSKTRIPSSDQQSDAPASSGVYRAAEHLGMATEPAPPLDYSHTRPVPGLGGASLFGVRCIGAHALRTMGIESEDPTTSEAVLTAAINTELPLIDMVLEELSKECPTAADTLHLWVVLGSVRERLAFAAECSRELAAINQTDPQVLETQRAVKAELARGAR